MHQIEVISTALFFVMDLSRRMLDLSWKFYGFARGEVCVLGMEAFSATRMFGAFWFLDGRIVGAFLEVRGN